MKSFALALLMTMGVISAAAAEEPPAGLPTGITCDDVRAKVAELGKIKALAMAIEKGATWRQLAAARRCLATR
jgi:hypothetical protein